MVTLEIGHSRPFGKSRISVGLDSSLKVLKQGHFLGFGGLYRRNPRRRKRRTHEQQSLLKRESVTNHVDEYNLLTKVASPVQHPLPFSQLPRPWKPGWACLLLYGIQASLSIQKNLVKGDLFTCEPRHASDSMQCGWRYWFWRASAHKA